MMNELFLLQFSCCMITTILALMLIVSRFQIKWLNHNYEVSRWLICGAMLFLSTHYVLQMAYGIRAQSDSMGALVNILFYTPIALVISYGTFNVICFREGRKRMKRVSALGYLLILAVFAIGVWQKGSLEIGFWLYVMLGLFVACMFYCISTTVREIRHHRKIIEEESATDLLPYDRYTWASYILMAASVLVLVGGIAYRPFLFIIGPFMLLSLFIFTMSFIGYGFNIMPVDELMEEDELTEEEKMTKKDKMTEENDSETSDSLTDTTCGLSADQIVKIEQVLHDWCKNGGFRDSTMNMPLLSAKLKIPRDLLSKYFESYLKSTFRVWLSDIRFQEAQRMLRENPHYNNDTISAECGFSSHAHLYKIFKAKTGMTPGKWKESLS